MALVVLFPSRVDAMSRLMHDLKNAVTAIDVRCELLEERVFTVRREQIVRELEVIRHLARRMLTDAQAREREHAVADQIGAPDVPVWAVDCEVSEELRQLA